MRARPVWDDGTVRWSIVAGAVGAGLAVGILARDLPLAVALAVLPGADIDECGMEEALSCAFENLPTAFGKLIELALLVLLVCAVMAALGAASLGVGALRLRRTSRSRRSAPADTSAEERPDWLAPSLIGMGTCLLTPGLWLLGSYLVFLAR